MRYLSYAVFLDGCDVLGSDFAGLAFNPSLNTVARGRYAVGRSVGSSFALGVKTIGKNLHGGVHETR